MIEKSITIEDLIDDYPKAVKYLADKGIRCIKCGEPIWGTLEEACLEKDFTHKEVDQAVSELNRLHLKGDATDKDKNNKVIRIKNINKN